MKNWRIVETASVAPQQIETNDDLSKLMDTSDEWIQSRTGIKQRHISNGENTSDLAVKVATRLLKKSGVPAGDIDLIIVATMSPDSYTPSVAAIVQGQIGARNAVAFDISAACSGFVYALAVAGGFLMQAPFHRALVIGSEILSKIIDWQDRTTAVLFGDGAGGVLIEEARENCLYGQDLVSFGELSDKIVAGKTKVATDFPGRVTSLSSFSMDGRAVYKFATHQVPASIKQAAQDAGIELNQVDHFLLHQANARIIRQVAKRLDQPLEKFPININEYGNTSAASEPLLLDELVTHGKIKRGDTLVLAGFGGGLTIGTIIIKY